MESIHYIGLDVHKKTIAYCVKSVAGKVICKTEGSTLHYS